MNTSVDVEAANASRSSYSDGSMFDSFELLKEDDNGNVTNEKTSEEKENLIA